VAPTGYSPVRDAVSEYGIGRFGWGYRAQVTFTAGAAACLAAALPAHLTREVVLLSVLAAARLGIAAAPLDERLTAHMVLAVVAFACVSWCAIALPRSDGGLPILGYVAVIGAIGTGASVRRRGGMLGLWERIFYAAAIAWYVVVAARLL
jgi:hypothetical protein